jgi:hypothetical protein
MTADRDPQDVEARLRASLRAYADVVDDVPPARSSAAAGRGAREPTSLVRRWRTPALVAAAVLAVAGGAWVVADGPATESPTAAPASTTADGGAEAAAAQPSGDDELAGTQRADDEFAAPAAGAAGQLAVLPPAEVGIWYPFDLYTHCGIVGADVAGVWFAADPPQVDEFGPPAGWDDPYQRGALRLETADQAVFRDDAGHELSLRAAESERPPPCA